MSQGTPLMLKSSNMLDDSRCWPTHQTEITRDKVALVYAIVMGMTVDLGKIIHASIMRAGSTTLALALPSPHIVTDLCHYAGVTSVTDELVLKVKALIIVIQKERAHAQVNTAARAVRALYLECAWTHQPPSSPLVERLSMGQRITWIERDMSQQRQALEEHRSTTGVFMDYIMDFTLVLIQQFPPNGPED